MANFCDIHFKDILREVAALMEDETSVAKYGGGLMERPISEQLRSQKNHTGKYEAGLERDGESGHRHIVAMVANSLIAGQHSITKPHLDDRDKRTVLLDMSQSIQGGYPYRKYPEYKEICDMTKKGEPVSGGD